MRIFQNLSLCIFIIIYSVLCKPAKKGIPIPNRHHLEDAHNNVCYALIMSSGSNKGPWQAGVVRGIAQKYHDSGKKLRWDLVGGTSVGAINAFASQFHPPGEELAWTTELVILWKMARQRDITTCKTPLKKNYARWAVSFLKGWISARHPFRYLCDNSPARKLLRELFLHRKHKQRLFFTNTMRYTDRTAHVFTEQLELEEIIEAVIGSGTIPGIFPIKYLRNLGYHVDGGFIAAGDLETAIKRCIAVGKAKTPRDVVIDFISAEEPRGLKRNTSFLEGEDHRSPHQLPLYYIVLQSLGILSDMVSSTSVVRQIISKYPDVTIRYLIQPNEEALMWIPGVMVDFSQWKKMHRVIEAGYKSGYNALPITGEKLKTIMEPAETYFHPPDPADVSAILEQYYQDCEARKISSGFRPMGLDDVTLYLLTSNVEKAIKTIFTEVSPYKEIFQYKDSISFATFMGPFFITKRCIDLMHYFALARGVRSPTQSQFYSWVGRLCNIIGSKVNEYNTGEIRNLSKQYFVEELPIAIQDESSSEVTFNEHGEKSFNNFSRDLFNNSLDDGKDIDSDNIATKIRNLIYALSNDNKHIIGMTFLEFTNAKRSIAGLSQCVNILLNDLQEKLDQISPGAALRRALLIKERKLKNTYQTLHSFVVVLKSLNDDIQKLNKTMVTIDSFLKSSSNISNKATKLLKYIEDKQKKGIFSAKLEDIITLLSLYEDYVEKLQSIRIKEINSSRIIVDSKHSQLILARIIIALREQSENFPKVLSGKSAEGISESINRCISIIDEQYKPTLGPKDAP
ncbi:secreted alpha beta hydrolyse [Cryptosporidium canis]|uniref:Secreted alpha beta hydrolyse n=1 Tax=Cryptosporidium canis TaxID=195482 RepID=A0ABQ8P748_9CRYT|nr:secreted alpha beta hydrolyse [Cryptosporidium canis]KAJ1614434.1 secreted alpha beta hydrolyse [Cryptosporidium canis]